MHYVSWSVYLYYLLINTIQMISYPAELKAKISGKTFDALIEKLNRADDGLNFTYNQRIVYFADTPDLDVYNSGKVLIRFRWNNEILESVIKIRQTALYDLKNLRKQFEGVEGHTLKISGDVGTGKEVKWGIVIKFRYQNINPAFTFFSSPTDYLSPLQKKFIKKIAPEIDVRKLKFGIPIESKACVFDTDYKEFVSLTLEEWRLPRLFGNKLYEISVKTETYNDKSHKHFLSYLETLDISVSDTLSLKTQRFYHNYFNL